jgi:hypothetical protein
VTVNRSLIVSITLASRVTSIKNEPEFSAAVVGWKFIERDKVSDAHPQKFHQYANVTKN